MIKKLGIDIGASTIKVVLLNQGEIEQTLIATHYGKIRNKIIEMIKELKLEDEIALCVTGRNDKVLANVIPNLQTCEEIPAITKGTLYLVPTSGSVIEIGSQSARFITELQEKVPSFSINEQCAGGTGSFFEDQMSRLGLKIEDYSDLVSSARSIPNLSGRCAVFAKTDIIHRQQSLQKRRLFVSGSPLGITSLNEGVLDTLSKENQVIRMPLSEMIWFLWKDNETENACLEGFKDMIHKLHNALEECSPFSEDPEYLLEIADQSLDSFAGGNGRYRFAKSVEMGEKADAVLILAPRYENTQMVLSLSGLKNKCEAPLLEISLDGDWDEATWSKLRSFLYYC